MTGLTVPGNLLLLGEYAVLEEGGLGVSVAVERRVVIAIEEARELTILRAGVGLRGARSRWERGDGSLVDAVVAAAEGELAALGRGCEAPPLGMSIDSTAFFDSTGRKIGLGSSAAVAVGTAQALLRYAGLEGAALRDASCRAALLGHRSYQGGRGSGYDIAASLGGGYGLFVGGERPSLRSLALPWMRAFSLLRGPDSVDTSRAVERYAAWRMREREAARDFLEASNEIARGFAAATNWGEAASRLRDGARLGLELGEAIGVSARIAGPEGLVAKALGAGNELAALWLGDAGIPGEDADPTGLASGAEGIGVAVEGPRWTD